MQKDYIKETEKIMENLKNGLHDVLDKDKVSVFKNRLGFVEISPQPISSITNGFLTEWHILRRYELIESFLLGYNLKKGNSIQVKSYTINFLSSHVSSTISSKNRVGNRFLKFSADENGLKDLIRISKIAIDELVEYTNQFDNVLYMNEYFNSGKNIEERNKRLKSTGMSGLYRRLIISKLAGGKYFDRYFELSEKSIQNIKEKLSIDFENYSQYYNEPKLYYSMINKIKRISPLRNPDLFSEENSIT